jgi:peptide/nickel transport system permease protein
MARAVLVGVGNALLSMLLLSVFVFSLARLSGSPLDVLLPATATPEDYARMTERLGLDKPLLVQYGIFLGGLVRGDLGTSFIAGGPVVNVILPRLGATLQLALSALVVVLVVGIPLGVYSAYWRGGWFDFMARALAVLGQSVPPFWFALVLIVILAVRLDWLPSGGSGGLDHMVLPASTLALTALAGVTRLVRSSMIEVLESDYVKFLRLKGMPEREILWTHALRNAGLSSLTFVGVLTAGLLTGSVVTEEVFALPGMGQLMAESITNRDFPLLQALVLVFSALYIGVNLLVDLLYLALNPRLRS